MITLANKKIIRVKQLCFMRDSISCNKQETNLIELNNTYISYKYYAINGIYWSTLGYKQNISHFGTNIFITQGKTDCTVKSELLTQSQKISICKDYF